MKYSISTLAKAVIAGVAALFGTATAAANGADVASLDFSQWLEAFGTALVASAALLHIPGKEKETPNDRAVSTVSDVVTKASEAHQKLTQEAVDSIRKVQEAAGDLTKVLPVQVPQSVINDAQLAASAIGLGPLAKQVLSTVQRS